jgi:hypothetical protein
VQCCLPSFTWCGCTAQGLPPSSRIMHAMMPWCTSGGQQWRTTCTRMVLSLRPVQQSLGTSAVAASPGAAPHDMHNRHLPAQKAPVCAPPGHHCKSNPCSSTGQLCTWCLQLLLLLMQLLARPHPPGTYSVHTYCLPLGVAPHNMDPHATKQGQASTLCLPGSHHMHLAPAAHHSASLLMAQSLHTWGSTSSGNTKSSLCTHSVQCRRYARGLSSWSAEGEGFHELGNLKKHTRQHPTPHQTLTKPCLPTDTSRPYTTTCRTQPVRLPCGT